MLSLKADHHDLDLPDLVYSKCARVGGLFAIVSLLSFGYFLLLNSTPL